MNKPLIKVDQVSKYFKVDGQQKLGVNKLQFDINDGEIVVLVGPSGCGKTTILKLLASIFEPSSGNISYQDHNITHARENRLIGLVPQSPILLPNRTVLGNIELPSEIIGKSFDKRINQLMNMLGLDKFKDFYPNQLSGGLKQRVSLARALSFSPSILLMDEPFSSLDELLREKLNDELLQLQRNLKQTIVFVTHNIAEAAFLSDRVIVMSAEPGTVIKIIRNRLPYERRRIIRNDKAFFEMITKIRDVLTL